MFESAEIGHRVSKARFKEEVPALREALLEEGETGTFDMTVGEGALKEMCVMHFGALAIEE